MTLTTLAHAAPKGQTILPADQRLVLRGVSWDTYTSVGDALDTHREVRLVYLRGTLTFMWS